MRDREVERGKDGEESERQMRREERKQREGTGRTIRNRNGVIERREKI